MPVITEDEIRSLAGVRGERAPVTTCYLDVDGRRFLRPSDYERVLDTLLRRARSEDGSHAAVADLQRIESYVKSGIDRQGVRGLAIFACDAHDLWKVVPLPVPVRSELVVNRAPHVGQLESVLQRSETIGVLLADRAQARAYAFVLGELVEHREGADGGIRELRDYDGRGESDRGDVDPHVAEVTHKHLRHAAGLAWDLHQARGLDHLVLAAPDPICRELENDLHPYLRERLRGRIDLGVGASLAQIRDAAVDLEDRLERAREAAVVADLRRAVATGDRGVAGLAAVLSALAEHRVERLLVSDGYEEPGWSCAPCRRLATVGRRCTCGAEMEPLADVVSEAVEEALAQSSQVEICLDNADLDVLGRIGALLRY